MKFVDQIVGFFILLAIIALTASLVFIGISQRWFAKNYFFVSKFNSSSGLTRGMSITLKGFEIGKINTVALDPVKQVVNVEFYIYDKYYEDTVFENSVLQLAVSPIGLGNSLVFHPGKSTGEAKRPALEEGSYIPSNQTDEGKEILKRDVGLASTGDALGDLVSSIGPLIKGLEPTLINVNTTLVAINDAFNGTRKTKIGQIIYDVGSIVSTMDKVVKGSDTGPLGNMVMNASGITDTLSEKISTEFNKIDTILTSVDNIMANLDILVADPKGIVVDLIDPKGSIKTLLDDGNVLFTDIQEMVNSVRRIIDELESVAKFITGVTPQISGLIEQGKETLNQGQDVLEGLKNNPLLSGGITKEREQPTTYQSYRDEEF
ncbi:MAG: MCE family protein [Spirochaetales bacterium]|nr:MCE family protein [Spirochaetales bacterium]